MNPIILHELGKNRQREILNQARHHHMVAEAEAGRPGRLAMLLARLGAMLVSVGHALQQPAQSPGSADLGQVELEASHLHT